MMAHESRWTTLVSVLAGCVSLGSVAANAMEIEPATTIIPKLRTPMISLPLAPVSAEPAAAAMMGSADAPIDDLRPGRADIGATEPPSPVAAKPAAPAASASAWSATVTREAAPRAKAAAPAGSVAVPLPSRPSPFAAANVAGVFARPTVKAPDSSAEGVKQGSLLPAPAPKPAPRAVVTASLEDVVPGPAHRELGLASFYSGTGRTASGLPAGGMTAAHRKLPFGTKVRVRDMRTGKEVVVTIIDRGPFKKGRVIDLSHMAARELGIIGRGIARVEVVSAN